MQQPTATVVAAADQQQHQATMAVFSFSLTLFYFFFFSHYTNNDVTNSERMNMTCATVFSHSIFHIPNRFLLCTEYSHTHSYRQWSLYFCFLLIHLFDFRCYFGIACTDKLLLFVSEHLEFVGAKFQKAYSLVCRMRAWEFSNLNLREKSEWRINQNNYAIGQDKVTLNYKLKCQK